MDIKQAIAKVAERHGILLRPDDPAFALVTLNELVLEAIANKLIEQVNGSISQLSAAAERIQVQAGTALANEVRASLELVRIGLHVDLEVAGLKARELVMEVHQAHSRRNLVRWLSAGLLAALALLLCGMLISRLI
jgi:hypothetical protein